MYESEGMFGLGDIKEDAMRLLPFGASAAAGLFVASFVSDYSAHLLSPVYKVKEDGTKEAHAEWEKNRDSALRKYVAPAIPAVVGVLLLGYARNQAGTIANVANGAATGMMAFSVGRILGNALYDRSLKGKAGGKSFIQKAATMLNDDVLEASTATELNLAGLGRVDNYEALAGYPDYSVRRYMRGMNGAPTQIQRLNGAPTYVERLNGAPTQVQQLNGAPTRITTGQNLAASLV